MISLLQEKSPQQILAEQLVGPRQDRPRSVDDLSPMLGAGLGLPRPERMQQVSGTDMMSVLRKWEQLFAGQAMQSANMMGNLNKRVAELETQLAEQSRDKQHLRERQDLLEAASAHHSRSVQDVEHALKSAERLREKDAKALGADLESVRASTASALSKLSEALALTQQRSVDLHEQLHGQAALHQSLQARLAALEPAVAAAHADLRHVQDRGDSWARAAADGHTGVGARLAAVETRVDRVERVAVPEARGYVDLSLQRLSASVEEELSAVRRAVQEWQARVAAHETASEDRLRELHGKVDRAVASGPSLAAAAAADAEPGRLRGLERAVADAASRMADQQARLRAEVESLFEQLAATVREADARHSQLVGDLHERLAGRLDAQGESLAAVELGLEARRAQLEELARLEVDGRMEPVEALRLQLEARVDAALQRADQVREDLSAQVQLAHSRARSAGRGLKALALECEELRRSAQAAREPLERDLAALRVAQQAAEEGLRAALKASAEDAQSQIGGLRQLCERSEGLAREKAEAAKHDASVGAAGLRTQIAGLEQQLASLAESHGASRSRFAADIEALQGSQAMVADKLSVQGESFFGMLREARSELLQRMDSFHSKEEALHEQTLQLLRSSEAKPVALIAELRERQDSADVSISSLRNNIDERTRETHSLLNSATSRLLQIVEANSSHALAQLQDAQSEITRFGLLQTEAGDKFQRHLEESEGWRSAIGKQIAEVAAECRRSVEIVSASLDGLKDGLIEHRRDTVSKFSSMDTKLVDDVRKILNAIELHKEAHDKLKASTKSRFSDMQKEEEGQLELVWNEFSAIRGLIQAIQTEDNDERFKIQALLQSTSKDLQSEVDKESAARAQAVEALNLALSTEVGARAVGQDDLQRAIGALSDTCKEKDEQFASDLQTWKSETQIRLQAVTEEFNTHVLRNTANLEDMRAHAEDEQRQREGLQSAVDKIRVLTKDSLTALETEDRLLSDLIKKVASQVQTERWERDAAITEVYRRLQVARNLDSILQQMQDSELNKKFDQMDRRILATSEGSMTAIFAKTSEIEASIEKIRSKDVADINAKLQSMQDAAVVSSRNVDELDRKFSGEVSNLALNVLNKHESVHAENELIRARIEEEHKLLQDVTVSTEKNKSDIESVNTALKAGENEWREAVQALLNQLKLENSERLHEDQKLLEMLKTEEQSRTQDFSNLSASVESEASTRASQSEQQKEEIQSLTSTLNKHDESLKEHHERIQSLDERLTSSQAGSTERAEQLSVQITAVLETVERHGIQIESKAGKDDLEEQLKSLENETSSMNTELKHEMEGILQSVNVLEAAADKDVKGLLEELKALESKLGAGAAESQKNLDAATALAADIKVLQERELALTEEQVRLKEQADAAGGKAEIFEGRLTAFEADYVKNETFAPVSERVDSVDSRLAAVERDFVTEEKLKAVSDRVDSFAERLSTVEGDYVNEEKLKVVAQHAGALDERLKAVESDYAKETKLVGAIERVASVDKRLGELEADHVKGEQLKAVCEQADALADRLAKVEGNYVKEETLKPVVERVETFEKSITNLDVRSSQAEASRANDIKRVTAAEDRLKVVEKKVEAVKGKGSLSDDELRAMPPIKQLEESIARVEAKLAPAEQKAAAELAAEAKKLEQRIEQLASDKASTADMLFENNKALNEIDTVKNLRKQDAEAIQKLDGRIKVAEDQAKEHHGRIERLEAQRTEAPAAGSDSGDALKAHAKETEEKLDAIRKAADSMESTLHMRIDKLMVEDLRKASNDQSKDLADLKVAVNVQSKTLDKLDKKVRKVTDAVKALEELERLNGADDGGGEDEAPAALAA